MKKRKLKKRKPTVSVSMDWRTMQKVILSVVLVCLVFIGVIVIISDRPTVVDEVGTSEVVDPAIELKQHYAFIDFLAPIARENRKQYGVLASISMAQAILESDWGNSELSAKYYNLFGVKGEDHAANSVLLTTKEFENGQERTVQAWFRVYENWEESMTEHAQLLAEGTSWDAARYQAVIQATDYVEAAYALESAGYATDPDYAEKLIGVIESNRLYLYDVE